MYFKAIDVASNTPTAFLPYVQDAQVGFEFSDVGSISFSYPKNADGYSALITPRVEIATFVDGVEIPDGRYRVFTDETDEIEIGRAHV
jgi:hypothetical protein